MFENKLSRVGGWRVGGWVGGGWLDQLKIKLTSVSAMAFVELGLELSFAIRKTEDNVCPGLAIQKWISFSLWYISGKVA